MKFILLLTVCCCGARGTTASITHGEKEGFAGEALTLECTLAHNAKTFSWKDPSRRIIVRKTPRRLRRGRQWPVRIARLENGNLRINSLSFSRDDGNFTCEVSGDVITVSVTVLARISDVKIKEATRGVLKIVENHGRSITCDVGGKPEPRPTIQWWISQSDAGVYQTNKYVLSGDRSLDGETVRCQATNRHRKNGTVISSKSAFAVVKVLYIDNPTVAETNITVKVGENAALRCSAEGNPPPAFEWTMSGRSGVIGSSADHVIKGVDKSSAGEYTCSVSNSQGIRNVSLTLAVVGGGTSKEASTSVGLVVGAVIGSLLLVTGALVIGVILWRLKTRGYWTKQSDQNGNLGRKSEEVSRRVVESQPPPVDPGKPDPTRPEYVNMQTCPYEEASPADTAHTYERLGDQRNADDAVYEGVTSVRRRGEGSGCEEPDSVHPAKELKLTNALFGCCRPGEEEILPVVTIPSHEGNIESAADEVHHDYEEMYSPASPVR